MDKRAFVGSVAAYQVPGIMLICSSKDPHWEFQLWPPWSPDYGCDDLVWFSMDHLNFELNVQLVVKY